MKIKTNLRAGAGGATGAGHNSTGTTPDVSGQPVAVVYVAPVGRCVGY
jgi:hypothetical protein